MRKKRMDEKTGDGRGKWKEGRRKMLMKEKNTWEKKQNEMSTNSKEK